MTRAPTPLPPLLAALVLCALGATGCDFDIGPSEPTENPVNRIEGFSHTPEQVTVGDTVTVTVRTSRPIDSTQTTWWVVNSDMRFVEEPGKHDASVQVIPTKRGTSTIVLYMSSDDFDSIDSAYWIKVD
jgi:hypothetical protein